MRKAAVLTFCLFCFPALEGCIFDNRHAGTSTSVTNPVGMVTGFAILRDGTPAAGARVIIRVPTVSVDSAGAPECMLMSDTVADSAGRYTVPLVYLKDAYMEIREAPGQRPGRPADSLEILLRRWPNGLPHDGKMGTFRLATAGDVTGRFPQADTAKTAKRWIGVRGTANFIKEPNTSPFLLKGVPAGVRELMEVEVPDAGGAGRPAAVKDTIGLGVVHSGVSADFGPIYYYTD